MDSPNITICIHAAGNHLAEFRRCLESVLACPPDSPYELRLGFQHAPKTLHYAIGRLCPDGTRIEREQLPEQTERFAWAVPGGPSVCAWHSSCPNRLCDGTLLAVVFQDTPIRSEYVVWLDEEVCVSANWWRELAQLLTRGIDYLGHLCWTEYSTAQAEMLQSQSWYTGVPFLKRDNRVGGLFMAGFFAARAERLLEVQFGNLAEAWISGRAKRYAANIVIGEIARQRGWSQVHYTDGIQLPPHLSLGSPKASAE